MPSSTFDSSLFDSLVVDVIDAVRSDLYPSMGVTPFVVTIIRRKWSGGERNVGVATTTSVTLDPPPMVKHEPGVHYEASPIGRQEEGEVVLTGVSLTMTEDELTGGLILSNEEFYYRLTDAHGQGIKPRYYVISRPPVPDRDKCGLGWTIHLRRAEVEE